MGYWRVREVTEKPGLVLAELEQVEWFKPNPDFPSDVVGEENEEFIDAEPGDEGADCVELGGKMKLDITNGPEMHPLDNILVEFRVLAPVEA